MTDPLTQPRMVDMVAFAIIDGSAGTRAAEHAREFVTANWTDALRSARAAIETMRTPTFAMKMAGAEAITAEHMRLGANYDAADDAWAAMISAALSQGGK